MRRAIALMCCILLLLSTTVTLASTQPTFYTLDLPRGHISTQINKVFQQSNGFLWIGSNKGIVRYDGHDYVYYQYAPGSERHINNNFIVDIEEDTHGNIWVATEAGLNKINKDGQVEIFNKTSGLPSNWIYAVQQIDNGPLLIVTDQGIVSFSEQAQKFTVLFSNDKVSSSVAIDDMNNLYMPLSSSLIKLDPFTGENEEIGDFSALTHNKPIHSYVGAYVNNTVYFSGNKGLLKWRRDVKRFERVDLGEAFNNDIVTDIEVHENKLWIALYRSGLVALDPNTNEIESYKANELNPYSLPSNAINTLEVDQSGNLWIGTDDGLTALLTHRHITLHQPAPDYNIPARNSIYYFEKYKDQFIVSSAGGIDYFDYKQVQWRKDPFNFTPLNIEQLDIWSVSSNQNKTWMASEHGLFLFDHDQQSLSHFSNTEDNPWQLPSNGFYTVNADSEGAWLTGYVDVGLMHFTNEADIDAAFMDKETDIYTSDGNYTYQKVLTSSNIMWLATTDGLFQVNIESGQYHHYRLGGTSAYIRVSSLALEEGAEVLWATTEGEGLLRIDEINSLGKANIESMNDKVNLPSLNLNSVALSPESIWLTTLDHIIKIEKSTFRMQVMPIPFRLKNLSMTPSTGSYFDSTFYVGTNYGILAVDTQFASQARAHEVKVTALTNNGLAKPKALHAFETSAPALSGESIEFSLSAFEFHSPDLITYFYRLNDGEVKALDTNKLALHDLWPGEYKLEVGYSTIRNIPPQGFSTYRFNVEIPIAYYVYGISLLMGLALVAKYIYQKKKHLRRLSIETVTDSLTGVTNRLGFTQQYQSLFDQRKRFALVLIDLDKFKDINDFYGHQVGDYYLQAIAQQIQSFVTENDTVARLSGDEFAVLLQKNEDSEDVMHRILQMHRRLECSYRIENNVIEAGLSIGVAIAFQHASSPKELYLRADAALYDSKRNSSRSVTLFNDRIKESLRQSILIKSSLAHAISKQEFELHYQPKVCSKTKTIHGMEALIRWNHKQQGYIPPSLFVEKAEETGDIIAIGLWVLNQACKDIKYLLDKDLLNGSISVNVSPLQLKSKSFVEDVKNIIESHNIPADRLEMEITETSLVDNFKQANSVIEQLKAIGVSIALDDFGSGYSSLAYLSKLSIDTLKLDRSLVKELPDEQKAANLIDVVFELTDKFNLNTVVEGIETDAQRRFFNRYTECQLQGYLFYRPMPFNELIGVLANHTTIRTLQLAAD